MLGGFLLNGLIVAAVSLVAIVPLLLVWLSGSDGLMALADPRWQLAMMAPPLVYPMWPLMPLLGGFMIAMLGGALGMAVIETEPAG